MNLTEKKYILNRMNNKARLLQLGDIIFGDLTNVAEELSGTLAYGTLIKPAATAAVTGATRHVAYGIGDITGTTAYGMGDPTKATYGVMISFGRTVAATSAFTGSDTSLDVRAINKLVNDVAYKIQAAYIKAKNYTGGTVGSLIALSLECVNDGTCTSNIGLKIGSDGSTITNAIDMSSAVTTNGADIKFSTGITFGSGTATPNWAAGKGSIYIKTDGATAKAMIYICTVATGTWVVLDTVIA